MGFKLGTARQPYAVNGEIKSKLSFKNSPYDKDGLSVPGNPVIRVPLPDSIMAEANGPNHHTDPNTIYLNDKIDPNSSLAREVINHEMIHMTDMKISPNKLSYTDNSVIHEGTVYPRKDINGKDMIQDIETGEWKIAGHPSFPWEKDADILEMKSNDADIQG